MTGILNSVCVQNNLQLIDYSSLHGGDINDIFHLQCKEGDFALKINTRLPGIFEAEAKGLDLLRSSGSFRIPELIAHGSLDSLFYLLIEFISPGKKQQDFWQSFGKNLAVLHSRQEDRFGLDHDNFIGSLPQSNRLCDTAEEFYITQRLEPQLKTAFDKGFRFRDIPRFYKTISDEIPEEAASLLHGDLWSGNYLTDSSGQPVLIDPASAFAPREMDLAMMQLFGGFPDEVFEIYHENFPLEPGWQSRTDIWQLYYVLVHLNLFGSGYLHRVESILQKYS